jgi:hypothetical protein
MIIPSQLTPAVCSALCILSTPNKALCIVVKNNTEKLLPFDGDVYLENKASQDTYNIFDFF